MAHRDRMQALAAATAHLSPPFAVVDLDAFDHNAAELVRRAGGKPIRVASKSVRCRAMIDRALARERTPEAGGDETAYLSAFLDEREVEMNKEEAHSDTTRVSTAQRVFLDAGNLALQPPLRWKVYGDPYEIAALPS